jgi:hypothetical protein
VKDVAKQKKEPKDVPTGERMATIAGAAADAIKHKLLGEYETEVGAHYTVDPAEVERLIEDWPHAPKKGAKQMLERYGPPNEATPTKLFWYRNGPWKRTVVTRDVVTHNFPAPHSDFLTQYIDYPVPVDKADEITRFDGSCLVDRTAGEVAARCDSEAANTITLNLMHEIATGKLSVEEARTTFGENMMAYTVGRPAPYAEQFRFELPQGGTEDPDETVVGETIVQQLTEKAKKLLSSDEA